jgi:PadR family transcriptional regulator PadR
MAKDPVLSGGALSLLILEALSTSEMHGYGIARWVATVTDDALRVEEGSLYPALHRLERDGSIEAAWATTENNRRAKYYRLTRTGRRRLALEREDWRRLADAMKKVVGARPERTA